MIKWKDLDNITTKEEICKDRLKLEDVREADIKSQRRAYEGTQTATLTMSAASTTKPLFADKVYKFHL